MLIKKPSGDFPKLLRQHAVKSNQRSQLNDEETKRLRKLEAIADKLRHGENVQNRLLHTWLGEEEY